MPQSSSFSIQFPYFSFLSSVSVFHPSHPCGHRSSCCQSFLPSVSIFLKSVFQNVSFQPILYHRLSFVFVLFWLFVCFFALLHVNESRRQQIISKIGNNGEAANPDDARHAASPCSAVSCVHTRFRFFQHKVTRDSQQLL